MKKIISAVTSFAIIAGMFAGFTDVYATDAAPITDLAGLQSAIQTGGSYILQNDISGVTASLKMGNASNTFELDMNGYDIEAGVNKVFDLTGSSAGRIVFKNTSEEESVIHTTTGYVLLINTGVFEVDNITLSTDNSQALVFGTSGADVDFVMNDCRLSGVTYGINAGKASADIVINNTDISVTNGPAVAATAGNLTFNGGTYTRTAGTKNYIFNIASAANVTINDAEVTSTTSEGAAIYIVNNFAGTLIINSGIYSNTAASKNYVFLDNNTGSGNHVMINGGEFHGLLYRVNNSITAFSVAGGTFSFDPSAYLADGASVTDNGDGTWTVTSSSIPGTAAPTAAPVSTETPVPTAAPTIKPIVTQPPSAGTVWAEKWSYNFDEFTTEDIYSSLNKGTLPGTLAPAITYYAGTVTSVSGIYGRDADDHHLALTSSTISESARIFHNIDNADAPVDNLVAELDIAFTTTTEARYVNSYRTTASMNGMVFSADGHIGCYDSEGKLQYFKDKNGADLTYSAGEWYHIANKFDFRNLTITYYLDGKELGTVTPPNAAAMTSVSEICYKGSSNKTNPGTTYFDNFRISQEQASYITSVVTSPESRTYLAETPVTFSGYAKNASGDIAQVIFNIDGEQAYVTEDSTYSFTRSGITPGHHKLAVTAISSDGLTGSSEEIEFTVANYSMPTVYADGMILQRGKPIKIGGAGVNGTRITASINGSSASATVSGGRFEITLPEQEAAKSATLTIESDGVSVDYETAIGEVILCNGQSNMAYYLTQFSSLQPLSDRDYEDIHLFKQTITKSSTAQTDIPTGRWAEATQSETIYFSAFGFGTGVKLYEALGGVVPVGLVFAAEGGTGIQQWVANGVLAADPDTAAISTSSTDYNCMVAPLTQSYTIGHVIWYQGEANTNMNQSYEKALTKYIDSLRADWEDEDIDFTIIQLPIYDYPAQYKSNLRTAIEVRAAEWNVSERLDKVATVVAIDTGNAAGIHPDNKLPLVERTAAAIMHFINPSDTSIVYKSPSMADYTQDGSTMTITFKDTAGGLSTKDGEAPRGFKIAGDDNNFVDADVSLVEDTIVVDTSSVIGTPKVRYAWEDCPALGADNKTTTLNLVGGTGLPMAPFRTDHERYMFKVNSDGSFGDPVNFTPMIRSITIGDILLGTAEIVVNARDYDDEIAAVEVFADGTSIGYAEKTGDAEYTIKWEAASAGWHTIYAIATDTAGATSIKQDPSLGTRSVSPVNYSSNLAVGAEAVFEVEQQLFNNESYTDGSWTAYFVTADITNPAAAAIKLGASNGETIKYVGGDTPTTITGSATVYFGIIAESAAEIAPTAAVD